MHCIKCSELVYNNFIQDHTAKQLRPYKAVAPTFYSMPKIHKWTINMRPIKSSIYSSIGKLEKFLTEILTNCYNFEFFYYIKDFFTFSTFINDF